MGARGPTPKRDNKRRRRNEPAGGPAEVAAGAPLVDQPPPRSHWTPLVAEWYRSLAESGQARYYEPSDWGYAALVAEAMHRELAPRVVKVLDDGTKVTDKRPVNGTVLSTFLRASAALLVTEGDRRRLRLELERPDGPEGDEDQGKVTWIDDARRHRLG